jgi:FKBP-type peptidyl-prolyl cis-trans isomerase
MTTRNISLALILSCGLVVSACSGDVGSQNSRSDGSLVEPAPAETPGAGSTFTIPSNRPGEPPISVKVVTKGTGIQARSGDTVSMHYTGSLLSGKKFDSSRDRGEPFLFEVGAKGVIEGWDETVAKMRVGDRWKVVIPWQKAYGERGSPPSIPAKTDLVFDIELLEIVEPSVEVLAKGGGVKPDPGDLVTAHYSLTIVGGKNLVDTRKGDPGSLQVGRPSQLRGLDIMVQRMRVGDRWKFTLPPGLAFGKRGAPPRIPADAELLVDIEMVARIAPEITVLKEGDGAIPKPGQTVNVHYTGTLADGTIFDSSRDKGTPYSFHLGLGEVIPGWDMTVGKMRVGERVTVVIPWQLAYGERGDPPTIPAKADLTFDIELLGIE